MEKKLEKEKRKNEPIAEEKNKRREKEVKTVKINEGKKSVEERRKSNKGKTK